MRRRAIHLVFGAAALLCAAVAIYQGVRLHRALRVNEAIASPQDRARDRDWPGDGELRAAPQAVLAQALELSRRGELDAAIKAYNGLISRVPPDDAGRAALFDLGNLYLRQGAGVDGEGAATSLPMIELAKQRYRDLLRLDPGDWDARYNLERALRLAPDDEDAYAITENQPVNRRLVKLPGITTADLP